MAVKKVTFKHFENTKIKNKEVNTSNGIFRYPTLYFRITYNRKTSAFNSYLFWDMIRNYLYSSEIDFKTEYTNQELEKNWPEIIKIIQDKDAEYIEILIQGLEEKYGYFDFIHFKNQYYECLSNFLLALDNEILKQVIYSTEKSGLKTTNSFLKKHFPPKPNISHYGIRKDSIKYSHPYLLDLMKELSQNNSTKYIDEKTIYLISVFKFLYKKFVYNMPNDGNQFAFMPIVYLKFENGRKRLIKFFEEEFSDQEITDIMKILNNIYTEFYD